MSNRPAVSQAKMERLFRALRNAGITVAKVEIEPGAGKVAVFTDAGNIAPSANADLDLWLAKHENET